MAYTQQQLDALRAAYARGVLEVRYAGQSVRYHSREDMRAIIAEMEAELSPGTAPPMRTVARYNSNLS